MEQKTSTFPWVSTAFESCQRQIAEFATFADRGDFTMHGILLDIAKGFIIGVGAGLTTAAILGLRRLFNEAWGSSGEDNLDPGRDSQAP